MFCKWAQRNVYVSVIMKVFCIVSEAATVHPVFVKFRDYSLIPMQIMATFVEDSDDQLTHSFNSLWQSYLIYTAGYPAVFTIKGLKTLYNTKFTLKKRYQILISIINPPIPLVLPIPIISVENAQFYR